MTFIYMDVALVLVAIIATAINRHATAPSRIRTVINVVMGLIVVGIALWLINMYVPMAGIIKAILNIVVVVATCVGVLQAFGLWGQITGYWRDFTHRHPAYPTNGPPHV